MDPRYALDQLLSELEAAGVRIVVKRGWFWDALHYLVLVVTFGGNRTFLNQYYTTIGPWIGVPQGWDHQSAAHRYAVLRHERIHVEQARSLGFGNAIAGLPLFFLLYVLLPFPIGAAYFRWRFERVAYVEGIKAKLVFAPRNRAHLIDNAVMQLTQGHYGWTATLWPGERRVRAYFEAAIPVEQGLRVVD